MKTKEEDNNIIEKKKIEVISCIDIKYNNDNNSLFDKVLSSNVQSKKSDILVLDVTKANSFTDGNGNPIKHISKILLSEKPLTLQYFSYDEFVKILFDYNFDDLYNSLLSRFENSIKSLYCSNCLYDRKLRPFSHKNCSKLELQLKYLFINKGNEFVRIIDKVDLSKHKKQRLAVTFFDAFQFHNGKITFRIGELSKKIFAEKFNQYSDELNKLDTVDAYRKIINDAEIIEREEITELSKRPPDVIDKDRKFLNSQEKKYQKLYEIDKNEKISYEINCNFEKIEEKYVNDFICILIKGIKDLLERGEQENCIHYLKKGEKNESAWRDWFSSYFQRFNYVVFPELKQGRNILDLKITDKSTKREFKVELKIWYNPDKDSVIEQISKYLTDFDKQGYIIMINDTSSSIEDKYKENTMNNPNLGYIEESWSPIWSVSHDYTFYRSKHKVKSISKEIYHFIINP